MKRTINFKRIIFICFKDIRFYIKPLISFFKEKLKQLRKIKRQKSSTEEENHLYKNNST